jgi:threonine/homoserine/homoserine lactone efflux protein
MSYLAILSVTDGKRAGLSAVAGVAIGLFIIGLASALGVATLISNYPLIYEILRLSGFLYLLWLAYDTWKIKPLIDEKKAIELIHHKKFFKRGLINNLLNPKAVLFYVTILPKFINNENLIAFQAVSLTIIYVLIATIIHIAIVLLGSYARSFLEDEKKRNVTRRLMAILLALVAIWFMFETKREIF